MAANALMKITREAKHIRKKHPGKSWKSAVKEASRKYNSGTISGPKKSHPKKKKRKEKAKPKRNRTRTVVVVSGTVRHKRKPHRKRKRSKYKVTHSVRRVSGSGGGIKPKDLLLIGGIGLAAWLLMKPKTSTTTNVPAGSPPLQLTANPTRDNQAQQILAWATAGGIALNAITDLIKSLNTKSDAQVSAIYQSIDSGSGVPEWAFIA